VGKCWYACLLPVARRRFLSAASLVATILAASQTTACAQQSAFGDAPEQQHQPSQGKVTNGDVGDLSQRAKAARLQEAYEWLMQGYAYAQAGNLPAAIEAYNHAISLSPSYLHAWLFRGKAHATLGDLDHALADYGHALQLQPGNTEVLKQRAVLYHNAMQYDLAIDDYHDVLAAEPGNTNTLMKRGLAYLMLDSYDLALADFDRILAQDPGNATLAAEATARRGDCFRKMGDNVRATAAYESALALDPGNSVALNGQIIMLGDGIGR